MFLARMVLRRRPVVAALRGGCLHFWDMNAGKQVNERKNPHRPRGPYTAVRCGEIRRTRSIVRF